MRQRQVVGVRARQMRCDQCWYEALSKVENERSDTPEPACAARQVGRADVAAAVFADVETSEPSQEQSEGDAAQKIRADADGERTE